MVEAIAMETTWIQQTVQAACAEVCSFPSSELPKQQGKNNVHFVFGVFISVFHVNRPELASVKTPFFRSKKNTRYKIIFADAVVDPRELFKVTYPTQYSEIKLNCST